MKYDVKKCLPYIDRSIATPYQSFSSPFSLDFRVFSYFYLEGQNVFFFPLLLLSKIVVEKYVTVNVCHQNTSTHDLMANCYR